jgi:beta-1,4-mannosyl-glycoprotein beta-1,4-N-acetylglucosaminyltransferase
MKRIFDCFTFFNEVEVLELRLRETYESVDYFVICEGKKTFQGKDKPLNFLENEARFAKYRSKIIYRVVDNFPADADPWSREHHQRNAIRGAVEGFGVNANDIVIVSDVDEILNKNAFSIMRDHDGYFQIVMKMYQFFMNYVVDGQRWNKPYAASWDLIQKIKDLSRVRTSQEETYAMFRERAHRIEPGGWHFTFLGGAERVREKISAYSHTESYIARLLAPGQAERSIETGYSVGGRDLARYTELDGSYPKAVTDNVDYYQKLGFIKSPAERIAELERAFESLSEKSRRDADLLGQLSGLIARADVLLKPYSHPHYREVKFGGRNLIPSSRDFSQGFFPGYQSVRAEPSRDVPPYLYNNIVFRHVRDDIKVKEDNNCGWFDVEKIGLEVGSTCTASCYVWVPDDSAVTKADLTLSGCEGRQRVGVNLAIRSGWQRISSSALITEKTMASKYKISTVFRVHGGAGCVIYSTCWQFEVGNSATIYQETVAK